MAHSNKPRVFSSGVLVLFKNVEMVHSDGSVKRYTAEVDENNIDYLLTDEANKGYAYLYLKSGTTLTINNNAENSEASPAQPTITSDGTVPVNAVTTPVKSADTQSDIPEDTQASIPAAAADTPQSA